MNMSKNALIVYATRCGSTNRVAQIVAEELIKNGFNVDLATPSKLLDVSSYDLVIVGSAIRAGKCMAEAESFVRNKSKQLSEKKTAIFAVCLTIKDDNEKTRSEVEVYLKPLENHIHPVSKEVFAGTMDYAKVQFALRFLMKKMGAPEGDFVDKAKIQEWTKQLATLV